MPSITTQNVASASAGFVQQPAPAPATQTSAAARPQDVMRASQIAATEQTHRGNKKDEARSTQIPKRAEGAFANQTRYTRSKKKQSDSEQQAPSSDGNSAMDVVA